MDSIQYDPERILNGLSEDVLRELAKKLKRRIRLSKSDIIQEILSPPKGKTEGIVKVWQEINWQLRKELEIFTKEASMMFSATDVPPEYLSKIGYMFTLSSDSEIKAKGEELYCQAEKSKELDKEDAVAMVVGITTELEARKEKETIETRVAEETMDAREAEVMLEAKAAAETIEIEEATEMIAAAREAEEMIEAKDAAETVEAKDAAMMVEVRDAAMMVEVRDAAMMVEVRDAAMMVEVRDAAEMVEVRDAAETVEARDAAEMVEVRDAAETVEARDAAETVEEIAAAETVEARVVAKTAEGNDEAETGVTKGAAETIEATYGFKTPLEEQITEDPRELQKRIRTLENKLRKAIADGLRTKGQLEKLKIDMAALKSQWVREKEETGKYRNRVRELEGERDEKEKELEALKQKLEQRKSLLPPRPKELPQRRELQKVKGEANAEIDLASYQGRKALIFAERDNEVDNRLNALGIIPIWAMEIDWNRPRRRMSTCEIVLYKMNDKKIKKLDEIRDIAKYWNIPCNELLNI
jgi:hypothetical protein